MRIRRETPGDIAGIRALVSAAFPTPAEADLVDALRSSTAAVISVVAVADREIVGHALLSSLVAPRRGLGLAPVAVAPAYQGQGIGTRLVRRALDLARASGWRTVVVLGDLRFYARFGFSAELARGAVSRYAGPHLLGLALDASDPVRLRRIDYPPEFADLV